MWVKKEGVIGLKGKVLFLVNHEIVIYNFRKEIVEKFLSEGYDVFISSPYGEKIEELISIGCNFVEVEFDRHGTNLIKELQLIYYYKKILKKIKPDIVLGFTIKPNIYGAIASKKNQVPFVANITGLGSAVENSSFIQKIIILLYRFSFSKIQTVFFQNTENRQFFIQNNIVVDKHKLLPGSGVNLKQYHPLTYPSDKTIEFVFISRIMKEKGIEEYLSAAKYIRNKYPNTKFHICGFCEENYEEKLRQYEQAGIIIYHGMIKDVRNILEKVHCTIHPTFYPEGLSNVLLESAASARPIITTNRSGTREVVDNEVNGYLVNTKDSIDLIKKIECFIKLSYSEKKMMGQKGREKVVREFDREIVIESYYNEVKQAGV